MTVAPNVQTLNIMKPNEMDIIAARRFPNVEKVNILCLFDCEDNGPDAPMATTLTLKPNVVSRIVPFLISVPKLKQVSIGGFIFGCPGGGRGFREYRPNVEGLTDSKNEEAIIALMRAFAGAFATRALNQTLIIKGFESFPWILDEYDSDMDSIRRKALPVFEEVCATFPFYYVLRCTVCAQVHELFDFDVYSHVRRRDTNMSVGEWCCRAWQFASLINNGIVQNGVNSAENKEERREIEDICAKTQKSISLHYEDWLSMSAKELDRMEKFIHKYFPKPGEFLTHADLMYFIFDVREVDYHGRLERRSDNYCYLLASTFDRLPSMGIPIRRNDPRLVILDDNNYPLLRNIAPPDDGRRRGGGGRSTN